MFTFLNIVRFISVYLLSCRRVERSRARDMFRVRSHFCFHFRPISEKEKTLANVQPTAKALSKQPE